MSEMQGETVAQAFPRAIVAGRWVAAILGSVALATFTWLFALQEGHTGRIFNHTWTQHDFPDALGNLVGAKDTARAGLWLTFALAALAVLLFAALERRLPGRGIVKGLTFGALLFLAWGLVFTTLVNSRQILQGELVADYVYLPTGWFGSKAGAATFVSGILASLATGIVVARALPLIRGAQWWQAHGEIDRWGIEGDPIDLLELPEQRPEQGVEGPG